MRRERHGCHEAKLSEARQAHELFRELGVMGMTGGSAWEMGDALLALGRPADARVALEEALDISERRGQGQ